MAVDRRTFLMGTVGVAAMAGPFQGLLARAATAQSQGQWPGLGRADGGYGPLSPVADERDGVERLALPDGFRYFSFDFGEQDTMFGGIDVPRFHDGMAAFRGPRGTIRLIRNHEDQPRGDAGADLNRTAFGDVSKAWDPQAGGGTTTVELVIDPGGRPRHVRTWASLNGTAFNCAGGPMPWGSWITCEETINGPDASRNFRNERLDLEQRHGYIFEVPVAQGPGEMVQAQPIFGAGRFTHEAVAFDPASGILYLTQDDFTGPSGLFRYIPPDNPRKVGRLLDGGVLQVLSVGDEGEPGADLSGAQPQGATYAARWITVPGELIDPDYEEVLGPDPDNDPAAEFLMSQLVPMGAAQFSRLEGAWFGKRRIFINATQGGAELEGAPTSGFGRGHGQVWAYDLVRDTITMVFESPGREVLEMPDNLTVTPRGTLLLCEDSPAANRLKGLTSGGELFDFALNLQDGGVDEFAGATFSPDGRVLFCNIQSRDDAKTFTIWGPFQRGPL